MLDRYLRGVTGHVAHPIRSIQHFSLDSQLSTSPILFVTDPFLIRRWAFSVGRSAFA
jgi:hypothetical protein